MRSNRTRHLLFAATTRRRSTVTAGEALSFPVTRCSPALEAVGLIDHDAAAARSHLEADLDEAAQPLTDVRLRLGRRDEQQETAAAGAEQLAAIGAGSARRLVDFVDDGSGDVAGEGALALPGFVHEPAEVGDCGTAARQ